MIETLTDDLVDEVIHADRSVTLRARAQRIRACDDGPPLAIHRTTLPAGPTRPPVVLVHGFAQNRYTWRLSRRSFSGFLAAAGYDVLNLELRGHGRSRELGAGNASTFAEYVSDLRRALDVAGEPAFVIGHSLGGGVAIGALAERPLRGLVHLAGVYRFGRHNLAIQAMAKVSRRIEPAMLRTPARVRTAWAGKLLGRLYRLTDVAGYGLPLAGWAPGSMERDLLEERLHKGFDWTSVEVWSQMARWADGEAFPYAAAWRSATAPVLVIAGDRDPLVTHADARITFAESGSPDKELLLLEPFEHQVHWGHVDLCTGIHAPDEVWSRILRWLDAR